MKAEIIVPGVVLGEVFLYGGETAGEYAPLEAGEIPREKERLNRGLQTLRRELREELARCRDGETEELLASFADIMEDESLREALEARIDERRSAGEAVLSEGRSQYEEFAGLEVPYLRERAGDILDLFQRLEALICGRRREILLPGPRLLLIEELTPMLLLSIGRMDLLKGVVAAKGSPTSHTALILKSYDIPYGVAGQGFAELLSCGEMAADLRGEGEGRLFPDPSAEERASLRGALEEARKERERLEAYAALSIADRSGGRLSLKANGACGAEAALAYRRGADGLGLVRSEFLFMGREDAPSEEEQFRCYKEILQEQKGRPVTIRTLDAGGDKEIAYLGIGREENPFLGYRAIRYCLDHEGLFRIQLRALLRASAHGSLQILVPFVTTVEEFRRTRVLLDEEKKALGARGIETARNIPLGCMIETPAALLIGERLAERADFFSIGTNDLIQYIMAADRGNPLVASYSLWTHDAVRAALEKIIRTAREKGIEVGVCGDIAGNREAIPFLMECGVDSLSVSVNELLKIKEYLVENYFTSIHV